jgi:hypothetical protein
LDVPPTHIWNLDETNLTDEPGKKKKSYATVGLNTQKKPVIFPEAVLP